MRFITAIEDLLRNIKYGIQNFWKYKTLIWKDRDWDWCYLYQLQEFKLREMANLHRVYGICFSSEILASEMIEAANCLQRLSEDDYYDEYYPVATVHAAYTAAIVRQKEDLKKFCKIFEEKSKGWWD
jgi:hypothetical protein